MSNRQRIKEESNTKFTLSFLVDYPQFVPNVAEWIFNEWGHRDPDNSLDKHIQLIKTRLTNKVPPLTLIGLLQGKPIATSSILIHELASFRQYTYWLGSLYVEKGYRTQGYGSTVVNLTAHIGRTLGLDDLHLYTHSHEDFYANLDFKPVKRSIYKGRKLVIMRRVLAQYASSEQLP